MPHKKEGYKSKPEGYFSVARREMLEFVPVSAKKILEAGCGEGAFSMAVKKRQKCEIWGVELDKKAAKTASKKLDHIITGDFLRVINKLPSGYFDCVIFNDVLEHMADPYTALSSIRAKIRPGGIAVASIPNVLHLSVLRRLLFDRDWEYGDFGVLDRTHLRFFTKKSIKRMFEEAGYEVQSIKGINTGNSLKEKAAAILAFGLLNESRHLQFAVVGKKK